MVRWLVVLALVTGCIESSLPTCGDLACPDGTTCVMLADHPRCAAADGRCSGVATGASCSLPTNNGACIDQHCVAVVCGDGIVDEAVEQCDDGATVSGDGCSASCMTERCGNGVTDPGESCDCGDPGTTPRPECGGHTNSDSDQLAPCRANCALRTCGDGQLDPAEQCEGNNLGGQTCESLGFYVAGSNALACTSFCTFDTSGCVGGRCGDGIVNGDEACDGTQYRNNLTCAAFGYYDTDPSHNGCTAFCTFDRTSCQHTCGDDVRDRNNEQCDGSDLGAKTCADFGFYRGALGCTSFCAFDSSACTGRCGDSVVDSGEYCDGSTAAVPGYCTDFGYSTGDLGCSALCGPSFDRCRPPTVFTDVLSTRRFVDMQPAPNNMAWLVGTTELLLYAESGIVATFTLPSPTVDASSVGTMVGISTATAIYRYRSAGLVDTITLPTANSCGQLVLTSETQLVCIAPGGARWWNQSTGWAAAITYTTRGALEAVATGTASNVYFTDYFGSSSFDNEVLNGGVYLLTPMGISSLGGAVIFTETLDRTSSGIYGGLAYGGGQYGGGRTAGSAFTQHDMNTLSGTFQAPAFEYDGFHQAFEVGGLPVWRANLGQVAQAGALRRTDLLAPQVLCSRMVSLGSTSLCLQLQPIRGALKRFAGASMAQVQPIPDLAAGDLNDAYIDENDVAYFAGKSGTTSRWPVDTDPWAPGVAGATFDTIIGRGSGAILLTGTSSNLGPRRDQLALWDGSSFQTGSIQPYIMSAALPLGGNQVAVSIFGGGSCTISVGTVNALAPIASNVTCPTSMWRSPTGALWGASKYSIERYSPTGLAPLPLSGSQFVTSVAISGVDDTHLWVVADDSIWFWNGTAWTRQLQVPGALFDWVFAARSDLVIASASSVTWVYGKSQKWTKMRLPSDPTPLVHPMLTSWGVFFRTPSATAGFAVWQRDWL